jgi:hypothetical protein
LSRDTSHGFFNGVEENMKALGPDMESMDGERRGGYEGEGEHDSNLEAAGNMQASSKREQPASIRQQASSNQPQATTTASNHQQATTTATSSNISREQEQQDKHTHTKN